MLGSPSPLLLYLVIIIQPPSGLGVEQQVSARPHVALEPGVSCTLCPPAKPSGGPAALRVLLSWHTSPRERKAPGPSPAAHCLQLGQSSASDLHSHAPLRPRFQHVLGSPDRPPTSVRHAPGRGWGRTDPQRHARSRDYDFSGQQLKRGGRGNKKVSTTLSQEPQKDCELLTKTSRGLL